MGTVAKKYRYKPIRVEAVKWDGTDRHAQEILAWVYAVDGEGRYVPAGEVGDDPHIYIRSENDIDPVLFEGEYLVLNEHGEFSTRGARYFEMDYEECG